MSSEMSEDGQTFDHWLDLLRHGSPDEQVTARTEIGLILEARGQIEAAADAYMSNVKARVRDRRPYERLAAICRQKGEVEWEARILLAMQAVFAEESKPVRQAPPSRPRFSAPRLLLMITAVFVFLGAVTVVTGFLLRGEPSPSWPSQVPAVAATAPPPAPTQLAPPTTTAQAAATPTRSSGAIAQGTRTPPGIDSRCPDPIYHFPEWADPEGNVARIAFQAIGFRPEVGPIQRRMWEVYTHEPDLSVAGWIATQLAAPHMRVDSPTLDAYVRETARRRSYVLRSEPVPTTVWSTIPSSVWQTLFALPSSDCVGAMLKNPGNARLVRLMSAAVLPPGNR